MQASGITFREARKVIGPMVGWPPEDVAGCVVVAVDKQGHAGFGATPNIDATDVPELLRRMAAAIAAEIADGAS